MVSVSAASVEAAWPRIPAAFRSMPQFVSDPLSARAGRPVVVKAESPNPIGCFKGRGTWLAVAELLAAGQVGAERGLVVASAGNFGQGVAYAARAQRVPLVVFAALDANRAKVDAMRRLGAEVREVGKDFDAAREAAAAHAAACGWRLLVDGEDPWIAIGAGTIGLELTEAMDAGELPSLATLFVPVGNGALIGGVGAWMRERRPRLRVVGVQAARAPAMTLSWRQRRPIETPTAATAADGIAVRVPVPEALDLMLRVVDEMQLVSEEEIEAAGRELSEALPLRVEPAAAAGWAAARRSASQQAAPGATGFILTGGNLAGGGGSPRG